MIKPEYWDEEDKIKMTDEEIKIVLGAVAQNKPLECKCWKVDWEDSEYQKDNIRNLLANILHGIKYRIKQ